MAPNDIPQSGTGFGICTIMRGESCHQPGRQPESVLIMNDELWERLELKVAYLERANHELSDVLYRQQRQLDELRARLVTIVDRLNELANQPRSHTEAEERPPHY